MDNKNSFGNYRVNDEIINVSVVRLIYKPINSEEGFNKIMSIDEARTLSEQMGLDLIEINSKANPSIVRLEDYSKFFFFF